MSSFIHRKRPRDFCDSDDESEDYFCSQPESYSVSAVHGNLLRVGSESDADLKGGKIAGLGSRIFQEPRLKASEVICSAEIVQTLI